MVKAQWIVTASVLSMAVLFGCNLVAQQRDSERASPEEPATAPPDNDARSRALQRTGLLPYRVDPADVISVQIDGETDTVQAELTVGPAGTIAIKDIGEFSVAGKTLEEIHAAIQQRIKDQPRIRNVRVQVRRSNSKYVYVCYQRGDGYDEICRMPCTVDTELNTLLSTMSWPKPISDDVQVTRSIDRTESTYNVRWLNGEATYLVPGDRIFVKPLDKPVDMLQNHAVRSHPNSPIATDPQVTINSQVTLDAKLIVDPHNTLVEYTSVAKGESLQAEAAATMTMLRILNKNKLIQLTALPTVTCQSGTTVNLVTEDAFSITICPTVNQTTTISMTAQCTFMNGNVQMALAVSDGKTLIVPLHDDFDAEPDSRDEAHCSLFLAITPTLVR